MYGKLFASMYDGTLYGQWQAIITLQQMVILADEYGAVDITPPALAAKTSIPLEIIEKGIEQLSEPDRYSRSTDEDGRRIVLIDQERPWGWKIVNYRHYRDIASREDKRRKDRERIAARRNVSQDVAECREVSQNVRDVAHTDTDTDKDICPSPSGEGRDAVVVADIVEAYHEICKDLPKVIKITPARRQAIRARWRNELPSLDDWRRFFAVVNESKFLTGRAPATGGREKPFLADIDFLIKQGNVVKIMEGKYDD